LTAPAISISETDSKPDLAATNGKQAFLSQKPKDLAPKKSSFLTGGSAIGD